MSDQPKHPVAARDDYFDAPIRTSGRPSSELEKKQNQFLQEAEKHSKLIDGLISSLIVEQHRSIDTIGQKISDLQDQIVSHISSVNNSIITREIFSRNYISSGSFSTQESILEVLRKLRPMKVVNAPKVRLGSPNDGGYVMIDDFEGIDTAFSFGIEQNVDWDLEAVERGLQVYQFDGTVDGPPVDNPNFHFEKKMIMPWTSDSTENIETLVARHDKGLKKPNIILKIDIEHGEWPVFEATTTHAISRFSQIIAEFHGFDYLEDPSWRRRADNVYS